MSLIFRWHLCILIYMYTYNSFNVRTSVSESIKTIKQNRALESIIKTGRKHDRRVFANFSSAVFHECFQATKEPRLVSRKIEGLCDLKACYDREIRPFK